jgi:hypothetical protein
MKIGSIDSLTIITVLMNFYPQFPYFWTNHVAARYDSSAQTLLTVAISVTIRRTSVVSRDVSR